MIYSVDTFPKRNDALVLSLLQGVAIISIENLEEPVLIAEYIDDIVSEQ